MQPRYLALLTIKRITKSPFKRHTYGLFFFFFFLLKTTGLKAAPRPQVATHRFVNQTSAENYEVPAVTEGEALPGASSGVKSWFGERGRRACLAGEGNLFCKKKKKKSCYF